MERKPIVSDASAKAEALKRYGEKRGGQYHVDRPHDRAMFEKGANWAASVYEQHLASSLPTIDQVMEVVSIWLGDHYITLHEDGKQKMEADLRTRLSSILPAPPINTDKG
jgi:hypothetical protein